MGHLVGRDAGRKHQAGRTDKSSWADLMGGSNEFRRSYGLVGPSQHLDLALDVLKVDLIVDSF